MTVTLMKMRKIERNKGTLFLAESLENTMESLAMLMILMIKRLECIRKTAKNCTLRNPNQLKKMKMKRSQIMKMKMLNKFNIKNKTLKLRKLKPMMKMKITQMRRKKKESNLRQKKDNSEVLPNTLLILRVKLVP
jgi:hypothetical protein